MWTRLAFISLLAVAGSAWAVPARAQSPWGTGLPPGSRYDVRQVAWDNGYREGLQQGARDARDRRPFQFDRHAAYRSGDWGYDRRLGNRGHYRQAFRQGFASGYQDAFSRYGGRSGRAVPRRDPGYGGRYPGDPGYGRYPGYPSRGGYRGGGYGYYSPAYEKGFADGYEKGRDDGRDRDRFDPQRHKWYRQGDRGYSSRFGSKDLYKREYRDAFRSGYEQGYRETQGYYGYGNQYPRGGSRWPF